ncbi:MAG: helix-turn-helix transcriptional regulator [Oscillospiraceae bacterium]|nr:helix-turn-helix transcriptional regulator [Oscillospiraceae bacterium]
MEPNYAEIGARIRAQREFLGLSRETFAEQIGITPKFCSDIELGLKGMSLPTLCRISRSIHLSTDFLLFGEEPGEASGSIALMLSQCSDRRRKYAEEILKIFLLAEEK